MNWYDLFFNTSYGQGLEFEAGAAGGSGDLGTRNTNLLKLTRESLTLELDGFHIKDYFHIYMYMMLQYSCHIGTYMVRFGALY